MIYNEEQWGRIERKKIKTETALESPVVHFLSPVAVVAQVLMMRRRSGTRMRRRKPERSERNKPVQDKDI
jgi:hypothetical protein